MTFKNQRTGYFAYVYNPVTACKRAKRSRKFLDQSQSWITQWAKGAAAQGPQSQGAAKAKTKKIHIDFDRRHAMQCFMCVQCMVIVHCRVSAVFTRAELLCAGNSHHRVRVRVCVCLSVFRKSWRKKLN